MEVEPKHGYRGVVSTLEAFYFLFYFNCAASGRCLCMPMLLSGDCDAELLKVLQHFCLLVPPARRRQLQILLRYLGKMSTNPHLVLHDRFTNKQQACLLFSICLSDNCCRTCNAPFHLTFFPPLGRRNGFRPGWANIFWRKFGVRCRKIFLVCTPWFSVCPPWI